MEEDTDIQILIKASEQIDFNFEEERILLVHYFLPTRCFIVSFKGI